MVADISTEQPRKQRVSRLLAVRPAHRSRVVAFAAVALAVLGAAVVVAFPAAVSPSLFVPLLVAVGVFLSGKDLVRALGVVVAAYVVATVATWPDHSVGTHWSTPGAMAAVLCIIAFVAWRRQALAVSLSAGTGLLGDLRTRLDQQAQLPPLGDDFSAETCVMPSVGEAFSGDFSVATRRNTGFQLALTDVSGHGQSAGMRALLLSGALSGLLGEVETEQFLPAANRYLIRQGWRDGFASCIHVSLDLSTGVYDIGTAGHPSAAHFHASTRTWKMVSGTAGLLLGLFELDARDYSRVRGTLEPGDILLLYTDGVVEGDSGDVVAGTQRMLDQADVAVSSGVEGAAQRICVASAAAGGDDDRSAVVIWRHVPPAADNVHEQADSATG